jgi:hypothetical protein
MTQEDYRRALQAAVKEHEELGAKRGEIDRRLAELAQSIGTLSTLLGLTPTVPLGLTDAIRLVMRGGVPMTPVEVRDRLRGIGFDVARYTNDLAAVHTILKRLNDAGELRFIRRADGRHQYAPARHPLPIVLSRDIVRAAHDNTAEREAMQSSAEPPRAARPKPRAGRRGKDTLR